MSCHFQNNLQSTHVLCIRDDLSTLRFVDFWQDVYQQSLSIQLLDHKTWALWESDSYEFLVLLFSALLADKEILIAPHRVKDLELELAEQEIYFLARQNNHAIQQQILQPQSLLLDDTFLNQAKVYFYTSGSTGQPKKIPRTLRQLLNEVQGLDQSFALPDAVVAIATVSHQHIYGLLFKLLWPLASGRSFYLPQLAFPEDVVEAQRNLSPLQLQNYVISSPALLKRWTNEVYLEDCIQIYSSGGKLDVGVRPLLNRPIIEVLGSSETGGIAHRHQDDALWIPFANVNIQVTEQQELGVKTNHAFSKDWIFTGDQAEAAEPNQPKSPFRLLGRLDRIIKLEEKRLSLDTIEHKILSLPEVEQCHVLVLEHEHRQMLACVVVLRPEAQQQFEAVSKGNFVAALKMQLKDKLESIAIPRQWRFLHQLPQNSQSKLNKNAMKSLFQSMLLPVVLEQQQHAEEVLFKLEFPAELICFKGHFPNHPIYPGVGQIGFIQHFSKQMWADLDWCNGYEQLKFQDLIQPYTVLQLKLQRKLDKVFFEMSMSEKILASGRLLFSIKPDLGEAQ
ncbi:AMP-binding protein [Acinetobacter sp. ANC 4648]|uniref:AMP-binding protein n=1 Tax=Acinetobacter sp. ANC 4648 TaxID=1977875 RepID=UPI000A355AA1|nr:AMP-binding protein [Acinetobacter sp. ANC 4648]OTG84743.1 acyl-CoA synthetase [Acinetobacter sp. ANC 4648]